MLKTRITEKVINEKFVDINKNISVVDIDLYRIVEYVYKKECQKYNTIIYTTEYKLNSIKKLKYKLNLKKKSYIDNLRSIYKDIESKDFISLYCAEIPKEFNYKEILNFLKDYKIIKSDIGLYMVFAFWQNIKNSTILNKLISISADIKKTEKLIKDFIKYYSELTKKAQKLNSYDLYLLKHKNIVSGNIRAVYQFYLTQFKKTKSKPLYNQNLIEKLETKDNNNNYMVTESDIKKLIEKNQKDNFKKELSQMPVFNESLYKSIINRYL